MFTVLSARASLCWGRMPVSLLLGSLCQTLFLLKGTTALTPLGQEAQPAQWLPEAPVWVALDPLSGTVGGRVVLTECVPGRCRGASQVCGASPLPASEGFLVEFTQFSVILLGNLRSV